MAEDFRDGRSLLYAELAERCADEPLVADVLPAEIRWDAPLRLFGAVHYLALAGLAPELTGWPAVRYALTAHRDFVERWLEEQPVQTNEVQRSWGLLPGFLEAARTLGRTRLDVVELGPSAGLNLLWDRYRYRYGERTWGPADAPLELEGEARGGPPDDLFAVHVEVGRRVGIDLSPVDVATEHGARLLQAFVWPDQRDRLERVRRAIEVVREEPPELVKGDYLELLPGILAGRDPEALTIVYHSASAVYLSADAAARLRRTIEAAAATGGLALVSLEYPPEERGGEGWKSAHALELRAWGDGRRRRLARVQYHGGWLEWAGDGA